MLRLSLNSCIKTRPILTIPSSRVSVTLYSIKRYSTAATEQENTTSNTIAENDTIHRVNLRVGQIIKVEQHPDADHLFIEQVNVNEELPRTIVSGLAPYMAKESLLSKRVIVVSNMKPSKFRGVLSQGMLLAAGKDSKVELLQPSNTCQIGERVEIESHPAVGEPDTVLKPKQKIFEGVAQFLVTDKGKNATYKGYKLVTSSDGNQPIQCETITDGQIS
ncbi:hypothetical protein BDA99DRAFT_436005 [Phascolomyces articulosus]|uniref:tRNA-binding domain-containing protein n=1 Tax=Phascolomyces articulosus TaxID=60185 RepID=A0AAD5PFQ8_9FUNG|nr:hypothetical protein BDA99DRAFT_436005 [Phascolomyces articulosus]